MKRLVQRTLVLLALAHLMLFSCTRPSPKQQSRKVEPVKKGTTASKHAPASTTAEQDLPVPEEIKHQLLNADEIRDGAELHAETIVIEVDQKRLLIRGAGRFLCSPTGNCPYWIVRRTADGYEQEIEGSAQTVDIQRGQSQFPEVLSRQHGSAFDSELRLYQFDGARYRLTKCMDQNYSDPNNFDHTLDKPLITEIPCEQ
jgi:hypothetical protein